MSLDNLISRIQTIHDKCGDPKERKRKEEEEANLDDFTRLKKQIAKEIKETRQQIQERNELLSQTDSTVATAKMSSGIRSRLREIESDVDRLRALQKKQEDKIEKKKAKNKPVEEDDIKENEFRIEIVELCVKHIGECKHLEKQGFGNANTAFFEGYTKTDEPVISSLPDIEDPDFLILRQNNSVMDNKIELIGQGVQTLHVMATEMGKEIEVQGTMIQELDVQVDKTNAELNNINKRLKKTLEKVRKGDRFCIDIILIIIVLAIGGYIYSVVKKSK